MYTFYKIIYTRPHFTEPQYQIALGDEEVVRILQRMGRIGAYKLISVSICEEYESIEDMDKDCIEDMDEG